MSASDVASALQTINIGITGVNSAPTEMPGYLNTSRLTTVLVLAGPAEHTEASMRHLQTVRSWTCWVYVRPIGTGRGVDEGYQETIVMLDRFRDEYATQAHTSNANWECLRLVADSGVRADMRLKEAGTEQYWGFTFAVEVTEFVASTA